jgi:hypothetical protein
LLPALARIAMMSSSSRSAVLKLTKDREQDETWFTADTKTLARSLQREFDIPSALFISLCSSISKARASCRPHSRPSLKQVRARLSFAKAAKRLNTSYNRLDPSAKLTAARYLRVNKGVAGPAARPKIASPLSWDPYHWRWSFEQVILSIEEAAGWAAEGRGGGRPNHNALRNAITWLRMFWEGELDREFKKKFGPLDEDPDDPNLKGVHPQNEASRFCCIVLTSFQPDIPYKSIRGAMSARSPRAVGKARPTKK